MACGTVRSAPALAPGVEALGGPLAVVAGSEGSSAASRPAAPLLSLSARAAVLPSPAVRAVTGALRNLLRPRTPALPGLAALDGWLIVTADPGLGADRVSRSRARIALRTSPARCSPPSASGTGGAHRG
jgi:hypothetical protein